VKTEAQPMEGRAWLANLGLLLPFLILYWVNLAHHTLFFDEINAWAIAYSSPTLGSLLGHVHFEGHPWLWYFLLWMPSRWTHNPAAMKCLVAVVGTAIYAVIGFLSPFTRSQKLLLFSTYFLVFEYTVMNRMYGVMFLLALVYVWRRTRKPESLMANAVLLGLMASVDMTGVLLAGALLLEYAYDQWEAWRRDSIARRQFLWAIAVFALMVIVSVVSVLPAKEISWQSSSRIGSQALIPARMLHIFVNVTSAPWWPISPEFPRRFQEAGAVRLRYLLPAAPVILFAYWWVFRRHRSLLLLMGLTLAFAMLFADVVYMGHVRHWGTAFISFVIALWMQSVRDNRTTWSWWAYGLIGLSAVAGVLATATSWSHPYSEAKAAAVWLKQNEPANAAIVGEPDVSFASLAEELDRPVYFLECGCVDTFKLFSRSREDFDESEMGDRLLLATRKLRTQNLIFALYRPMGPTDFERLKADGLDATPIAAFAGSECEDYYLYRIKSADQSFEAAATLR